MTDAERIKMLEDALRDCVELLTANQSTTTRAGLDADMVIDNAMKALNRE